MNSRNTIGGAFAIAALSIVLGAHQASAQNFAFSSTYADNTITSGTSTLTIVNGGNTTAVGAPSAIVLSNLSEFTTPNTGTNTFTNSPYSTTLTIFDVASNSSISHDFTGVFNGTADGGTNGNAKSALFSDTPTISTESYVFADGTYTVSRYFNGSLQFTSPGPGGVADGAQGAIVTFAPAVAAVPETGGAVAFLIGGSVLGLLAFRRRSAFTPTA